MSEGLIPKKTEIGALKIIPNVENSEKREGTVLEKEGNDLEEKTDISLEEREEQKKCILGKIDEILTALNSDIETRDDGLIEKIEEFKSLIESIGAEEITVESHFKQIIGTLAPCTCWIVRREKLREKLQDEKITKEKKKEIEGKINNCEKPVAEIKQSIFRYATMCLSDEAFLGLELSSRRGFWGKKAISVTKLVQEDKENKDAKFVPKVVPEGIADMEYARFINHCWEHYDENGKVSREIKLAKAA